MDFEKPLYDLEARIRELQHLTGDDAINVQEEIIKLQGKASRFLEKTYSALTPWQKVQVARHPGRPHSRDYIKALIDDFISLAGDRHYRDDSAIIGGLGRFEGQSVMIIGHEKGGLEAEDKVAHNFGMAQPEGYRKAIRLMRLADRFSLPVLTFIDTPGAYPGVEAENHGQSEAIGRSIEACLDIQVPIVSIVIGEGGSGGAIALATSNYVAMFEHAVYSVISPEGCASILWRDITKMREAAGALKITAQDLIDLGIIDDIITEPAGGAHRHPQSAIDGAKQTLTQALAQLKAISATPKDHRRQKFLNLHAP